MEVVKNVFTLTVRVLTQAAEFFYDEAWFYLDRYINAQNYRLCGSENLHAYNEKGRFD